MVRIETNKVKLRPRSSRSNEKEREVETKLCDYGDTRIPGTNVIVSVAVATFTLKGEDRYLVLRLKEDKDFGNCQRKIKCEPKMGAFVAVFDGHDGDLASEYCRQGLVPHILSELAPVAAANQLRWSFTADRACAPLDFETIRDPEVSEFQNQYIAAFTKAHSRFCKNLEPPSFDEITKPGPLKTSPPSTYNPIQWMASSVAPQRGGTTACTMSIFVELGEDLPQVVVANVGDSCLITDDARGGGKYRQVTTQHRPSEPAEKRRLADCVARGEATLHANASNTDVRIFPGGLAVSRTIGDGNCSKSVISTPEVINVPLKIAMENAERKTQRFVIASDGVWDSMSKEGVGKAASRKKCLSVREAAAKLLQTCLDSGGHRDDVTICVVDISFA